MVVVSVIIPNMDYRTTFFGQLNKPYDALRFLNFTFCVARSNKPHLATNMYSSLPLWWLFIVIIPNMDYRTTFFGQLKKPYDAF